MNGETYDPKAVLSSVAAGLADSGVPNQIIRRRLVDLALALPLQQFSDGGVDVLDSMLLAGLRRADVAQLTPTGRPDRSNGAG